MSEFTEFLHEVFIEFGSLQTRKMFGGWGVYHQGIMFGLVADDELYLKVDEENQARFCELELEAFEYEKNGKVFKMSYHRAPEDIFDDVETAKKWAELAFAAALRAKSKKK